MRTNSARRGFTLVEVVAGLFVFAILSATLTVCYLAAARTIARANTDRSAINDAVSSLESGEIAEEYDYETDSWVIDYSAGDVSGSLSGEIVSVTKTTDNPRGVTIYELR